MYWYSARALVAANSAFMDVRESLGTYLANTSSPALASSPPSMTTIMMSTATAVASGTSTSTTTPMGKAKAGSPAALGNGSTMMGIGYVQLQGSAAAFAKADVSLYTTATASASAQPVSVALTSNSTSITATMVSSTNTGSGAVNVTDAQVAGYRTSIRSLRDAAARIGTLVKATDAVSSDLVEDGSIFEFTMADVSRSCATLKI